MHAVDCDEDGILLLMTREEAEMLRTLQYAHIQGMGPVRDMWDNIGSTLATIDVTHDVKKYRMTGGVMCLT